ncbi:MAG: hypothetical protein KBS81_03870 [Spirochaetales bacterium]|nr:hypothetical protein [Candidatus Physcosoma equi]
MTYSEVREMYTRDMVLVDEERANLRRAVKEAFDTVFHWILPWSVSMLAVFFDSNLLNAEKSLASIALFFVSLLFGRMRQKEEGMTRLLSIALSYLVAVAVLMTVLPVGR